MLEFLANEDEEEEDEEMKDEGTELSLPPLFPTSLPPWFDPVDDIATTRAYQLGQGLVWGVVIGYAAAIAL